MIPPRFPHRTILTIVLAVLAIIAAPAPASAEPGSGAEVVHSSQCQTFDDGTTFCSQSHSVFQGIGTPSGNGSLVQLIRFENSVTAPGCSDTSQGFSRNHLLSKDGTDQEFHFAFTNHSTFDCDGVTVDCITTLSFHLSNGVIQFVREETVCTDPS
jgi:hypothetical protein